MSASRAPAPDQSDRGARVKTDTIDAKTLAHLLRAGFLREAYIAPRELRDLRELLRHRTTLTRMRSALKNRVPARAHLPPGLTGVALGAGRGSQKITTGSGPLREEFERIAKRRGRKIAKVAIAREILTLRRTTRPTDPLPSAPQPREREGEAGGMTRRPLRSSNACAHDDGATRTLGRARRLSWPR